MWRDLRDALIDLYDGEDMRRVVAEAGIPAYAVNLDGASVNAWAEIVAEARRRQREHALVAVALREFPQDARLLRIAGALEYLGHGSVDDAQVRPTVSALSSVEARLRRLEMATVVHTVTMVILFLMFFVERILS